MTGHGAVIRQRWRAGLSATPAIRCAVGAPQLCDATAHRHAVWGYPLHSDRDAGPEFHHPITRQLVELARVG